MALYGAIETLHDTEQNRTHPSRNILRDRQLKVKQVELYAKFSMQPKADMVHKECGFNQSETASCLCAREAWRFRCSPAMARDGELIQRQYFCYHANTICHPNSSYVTTKLYETSACGCNDLSERVIFMFSTIDVCSLAAQKPWWCCENRNIIIILSSGSVI